MNALETAARVGCNVHRKCLREPQTHHPQQWTQTCDALAWPTRIAVIGDRVLRKMNFEWEQIGVLSGSGSGLNSDVEPKARLHSLPP